MSSDMTIAEFCDQHGACCEGRGWALANCATMADVWATARPDWLVWVATRRGVLGDRELRLFAVFCARQVQHLITDPRSLAALDVAERHARGEASDEEMGAARDDARDAANAACAAAYAACDAACAACDDADDAANACAAACAACDDADDAANACDAAYAACADAAYACDAACDAAYAVALAAYAACDATYADQAAWLRENTKPDFTRRAAT